MKNNNSNEQTRIKHSIYATEMRNTIMMINNSHMKQMTKGEEGNNRKNVKTRKPNTHGKDKERVLSGEEGEGQEPHEQSEYDEET